VCASIRFFLQANGRKHLSSVSHDLGFVDAFEDREKHKMFFARELRVQYIVLDVNIEFYISLTWIFRVSTPAGKLQAAFGFHAFVCVCLDPRGSHFLLSALSLL
jgi:hypothetical protein